MRNGTYQHYYDQALLAGLLTAYHAGTKISLVGNGQCEVSGEIVDSATVASNFF